MQSDHSSDDESPEDFTSWTKGKVWGSVATSKGRRQLQLWTGAQRRNKVSTQTFMKLFPSQLVAKLKYSASKNSLKATTGIDMAKRKLP